MLLLASPMRRRAAAACSVLLLGAGAVGCGSDSTSSATGPTPDASSSPTPETTPSLTSDATPSATTVTGTTIDITITATSVDPSGQQLKVQAGKPITLRITAEGSGELHVHSSPEQEIAYPSGTSEHTLTLDQPGLVDVEDHELDKLIVKLEVR
ncbi:MAG: hypothetical protein ABIN79_11855 [Marmoricola sp.]